MSDNKNQDFQPGSDHSGSELFINAALNEAGRLGTHDDEAFLERVTEQLQQRSETENVRVTSDQCKGYISGRRAKTKSILPYLAVGGSLAAIIAGGVFLVIQQNGDEQLIELASVEVANQVDNQSKKIEVRKMLPDLELDSKPEDMDDFDLVDVLVSEPVAAGEETTTMAGKTPAGQPWGEIVITAPKDMKSDSIAVVDAGKKSEKLAAIKELQTRFRIEPGADGERRRTTPLAQLDSPAEPRVFAGGGTAGNKPSPAQPTNQNFASVESAEASFNKLPVVGRLFRDGGESPAVPSDNNANLRMLKKNTAAGKPPLLKRSEQSPPNGQLFGRHAAEPPIGGFHTKRAKPNHTASGEKYADLSDNEFTSPLQQPLSTFSVDVDTASYTNIRRMIQNGQSVPPNAVRIEEMINYFSYQYPQPKGDDRFAFAIETAECPWDTDHQLMRVGIQGKAIDRDQRPDSNLVFLIDVSGSMNATNKLPLVKKSMELLIEELTERDTISVVVYAGSEGVCLQPTKGNQSKQILSALDNLKAGGSTNGGAGINLAYKLAKENFIKDGVNRVILCTDGDFNVGTTAKSSLVDLVKSRARQGTYLSVLGFGNGNINDSMLEAITNHGNGNYFYIDSLKEGRKVLMQDMMSTLVTIAKDVKIQIEFNPKHVQQYRLIGYANRMLKAEDFNNDKVDAGEIGAGHSVTALYQIVPAGAPPIERQMTKLKYQQPVNPEPVPKPLEHQLIESDELCTVKLRYKKPNETKSQLIEQAVNYQSREWLEASDDYQFAAAVALWGMQLRGRDESTDLPILQLAEEGLGNDPFKRRAEMMELVKKWMP